MKGSTTSGSVSGQLRVMATTDLHMQLLGYDYFADCPSDDLGLVNLAHKIAQLRGSAPGATVLCDNGDLIQGNPLADHVASRSGAAPHPMIAALNLLRYDAMTLGNHEFDYGLDFLRQTLAQAQFPVVSANIQFPEGPAPYTILTKNVPCADGTTRTIRLGITGFGPPQIANWDHENHLGFVRTDDIVAAATDAVIAMKADGADLIIALCHSGIGAEVHVPGMENAAVPLAGVDGIDAIIAGHTHGQFPHPAHPRSNIVNPDRGTIHKKPTVMAMSHGRALGVIDLELSWSAKGWNIADHAVRVIKADGSGDPTGPLDAQLRDLVSDAHAQTLRHMRTPIAQTAVPIQSYFATIQPDLSQQVLAKAMQDAVRMGLADGPYADLPILAATAPFRFGGQTGLGRYIDIPPGPITLHDVAAIFPFADTLFAVRRSGAQIADWLERGASYFNQMRPGDTKQELINPLGAGYHCDSVFGLRYEIDLCQPARCDAHGQVINPTAHRIKSLRFGGRLIKDDDQFVVATNSYRARGGGGFAHIPHKDVLIGGPAKLRDVLATSLRENGVINSEIEPTWAFTPMAATKAVFVSAPEAAAHMAGNITALGTDRSGASRYQISF